MSDERYRVKSLGRALDLLLTGRIIDASEALSYGLVEYLFPDQEMVEFGADVLLMYNAGEILAWRRETSNPSTTTSANRERPTTTGARSNAIHSEARSCWRSHPP